MTEHARPSVRKLSHCCIQSADREDWVLVPIPFHFFPSWGPRPIEFSYYQKSHSCLTGFAQWPFLSKILTTHSEHLQLFSNFIFKTNLQSQKTCGSEDVGFFYFRSFLVIGLADSIFQGTVMDYLLIWIFAGQFLLSAQHRPRACDQNEADSWGRDLLVPEGCEGYHGPCAPAGDPVCRVSLEALQQDSWEDLWLCHALSDSFPGKEPTLCLLAGLFSY